MELNILLIIHFILSPLFGWLILLPSKCTLEHTDIKINIAAIAIQCIEFQDTFYKLTIILRIDYGKFLI
jgi:hypothetical protein